MVQSVLDGVISWNLLQHARTDTHTTKWGLETHPTFPTYLISSLLNIIFDYLKAQILRGSEQGLSRKVTDMDWVTIGDKFDLSSRHDLDVGLNRHQCTRFSRLFDNVSEKVF